MDVVTGESSGSSGQLLLLYPMLICKWLSNMPHDLPMLLLLQLVKNYLVVPHHHMPLVLEEADK
jgi:hypothetical protein